MSETSELKGGIDGSWRITNPNEVELGVTSSGCQLLVSVAALEFNENTSEKALVQIVFAQCGTLESSHRSILSRLAHVVSFGDFYQKGIQRDSQKARTSGLGKANKNTYHVHVPS